MAETQLVWFPKNPKKPKRRALPGRGRGFGVRQRGRLTLIAPESKRGWTAEERIYRSLIYDRDGQIVSVGLPKFFTAQQQPSDGDDFERALALGEAVDFSVKMDGALAIRSVDRGTVIFRTRNSFDGEHYGTLMRTVAERHYPILLEPTFLPDHSLHFEFISPKTRVVLPYPTDDLIFIGGIRHSDLRLLTLDEAEVIADAQQLHMVERPVIDVRTLAETQTWVDQQTTIEGLVVRWNGGQQLLKIKNPDYAFSHEVRFLLHPKKVWSIYHTKIADDQTTFLARFKVPEHSAAREYMLDLYARCQQLTADIADTMAELTALADAHQGETNKQFAVRAHALGLPRSVALLAVREGKPAKAETLLTNHWVKERFGDPTADLTEI